MWQHQKSRRQCQRSEVLIFRRSQSCCCYQNCRSSSCRCSWRCDAGRAAATLISKGNQSRLESVLLNPVPQSALLARSFVDAVIGLIRRKIFSARQVKFESPNENLLPLQPLRVCIIFTTRSLAADDFTQCYTKHVAGFGICGHPKLLRTQNARPKSWNCVEMIARWCFSIVIITPLPWLRVWPTLEVFWMITTTMVVS